MWSPNELLKIEKQRDILSYITLQFFHFKKVPLEHCPLSSGSFSGYEHEAGRLKVTAAVPILEPLRFSYHILNPSGAGWAF